MRKFKILIQLLAALTCLGAAFAIVINTGLPDLADYSGGGDGRSVYAAPEIGSIAPDFVLTTAQGSPLSLDQIQSEFIILNFWATWCGPCRREMRDLQQLDEVYRGKLRILGVNLGESAKLVESWIAENGLTFDILLDSHHQVSQQYRIRGAPTTFLLDRAHRITQVYFGAVPVAYLLRDIERLSKSA